MTSSTKIHCQLNEYPCLEISTLNWSCLPLNRAGDQRIDCIGGIDEQYNNSCTNQNHTRFQCFNSTKCLSSNQLCDGYNDCPFNDDENILCPWLNKSISKCNLKKRFQCGDGRCLSRKEQCNQRASCDDNEDEWFCPYNDEYQLSEKKILIKNIEIKENTFELTNANHFWYCNHGLPIYSFNKKQIIKCLCSPNFYGQRCEYQSNHLILTYRIDAPQYLENQFIKFFFYLYNINTTKIIDYEQILHSTLQTDLRPTKYIIHLIYLPEGINILDLIKFTYLSFPTKTHSDMTDNIFDRKKFSIVNFTY